MLKEEHIYKGAMKSIITLISRSLVLSMAVMFLMLGVTVKVNAQATCSTPTNIANFGIDGDVHANTPAAIMGDSWFYSNVYPGTGIGVIGTTAASATPAMSSAAFKSYLQTAGTSARNRTYVQRMSVPYLTQVNGMTLIDAFAARDNFSPDSTAFTGSNKNGDNPSIWTIGYTSVPTKNDIIDVGGHLRRQSSLRLSSGSALNDLWMYTYVTRLGTSGDAYTDIEIYRTVPYVNPATGQLMNTGPAATGGHTAFTFNNAAGIATPGDIILCVNYNSSGGVASARIWCNINNLDGNNNGITWFNAQPGRPFNFTGDFITGTGANGYGYAEIQSLSGASCLVYSVLNPSNTPAGDWGNLTGPGASFDTNIEPTQLVNIAFNFTDIGLDFSSLSGPCYNIFGALWFKTRSSSSYSSELKDACGPYTFGNFSEIQVNAGPDKTLNCVVSQTTLDGSSATAGAIISWSTPNGNIVSGASSATPTVNAPGTYIMSATNPTLSSCVATDTVIVTFNTTPPTANAGTDKQITCTSPTVMLNGSSLTAGAGYSWVAINDGNIVSGASSPTPVVNAAGCYILTVVNPVNGCSGSDTVCVTLNNGAPVISGTTQMNVGCFSACTGSINYTISSGQSPYTYAWSNGATTQNISALCAGTYTVTVSGSNGCSVTASYTISQPSATLSSLITVTQNVSCNNGVNGAATASATGGTAPYSYVWSNGASTATVNGLSAGTYTVTVTDQNGCTSQTNASVTQPSAATSVSLLVSPHVYCFGGSNGVIYSTPSGGTSPYTYLWNTGAATQNLSGIATGTYTVTLTDANGCTAVQSILVTQPPGPLVATPSMGQSVGCFGGSTGSATVVASGGTAPYSYVWSNSATSTTISNLTSGIYTITVTDAYGCTTINSTSVTQPSAALSSSITSSQNINCFGGNNGAVNLTVNGGTAPYSYNWSNGASTQDLSNLTAGTYNVTVTDSRGCTTTASVTLTQPGASLSASATASQNVLCFGGNSGSISLNISGGTSPFTYNWSNGASTQNLSGVSSGIYTVTITDANGCIATTNVTVTQPSAALSSSLSVSQNVSCFGGNNGAITTTVNGGTSPYTFIWNTGSSSQNLSGLSSGSYTVTITDANGCTVSRNTTVTQPSAGLSGSLVMSQAVSCFNGANGALNLTVNGGTVPYTYVWSNGASTQDLSGIAAGTYTVTVSDANGCSINYNATITQPAASLTASASASSNVSCFGGSNGAVNLSVNGGTSPFTYVWSNGATSQNISALASGNYTVTVTDINGCTTNATATVTQPLAALSSSLAITQNVSCFAGNNGSLNLTVSNGTAPYTYSWSNGATTQDISSLASGTYTVTITDANGCTNIQSATISQPVAVLSASAVSTQNVSCFGGNNGAVNLTVAGGTAPYSYIWSNGIITQDMGSLAAGTYSVTITDANGCVASTSVVVTQPSAALSTSITSSQNVNCFGGNTGSVNLTVTNGTAPYTYNWSNGATTQDISGLTAGTYSVTVTDANGCISSQSVTITQPVAALASSAVIDQNVSCFGGNNGSVNLSVSGGTAPYSYNWSNGQTSQDLSGLASGNYTVTITDQNGCTTIRTISISQPSAALAANATQSQAVSCNAGNNGQISLAVSGGTAPYSYSWSNGASTQAINNLIAGIYTVTVTDANGCTAISSAAITQPSAALSGSTTTTSNISCFSGNNGSIDLTVAGGTGPFTYMWSNGAITEDLTGLPAGNYSVTITDANGCIAQSSGTISQPAGSLAANLNVSQNVNCFGGGNGALDLTVSGGTAPYTYNWSNGATTEDISGLAVGFYTVSISDANGCISSATGVITQPSAALSSTVSTTQNVSCFGGGNGSLDLSVSGGTAPYSYNWSNGSTSQDINNLSAGTYTVSITDINGCTTIQSGTVGQPAAALSASAVSSASVSCYSGANGSANLTVNGGTAPYTFSWSNGATTEDISGLSAGTYNVNVTDANGCNATASVTITEPAAAVSISISSTQAVSCFGGNDGQATIIANGGTAPYTYLWNTGIATSTITGLSTGTYTVTVTDNNGCTGSTTVTLSQPVAPLGASITAGQNVSCFGGSDGTANLTVNGGTSPYTYLWNTGAITEDVSGLSNGTYTVTVTDINNCITSQTINISQPSAAVSGTAVVTANISCFSGNNGTIDLTPAGGTSPYTFQWSTGAITEDVSGLGAGLYTVTITDINGCTANTVAEITQPAGSLATSLAVSQNVLCFSGNTGSLDLTVNGGTAPYTYLWNNGAATQDISGLSTGVYTVNVTDANGCISLQSAFVNQPSAALSAFARAIEPVLCFAGSNGLIDLNINGGTAPYTFVWNTGAVTEDLNNLSAGSYTVTITDANGCTFTLTETISQPAAALATSTSVTQNVLCNSGNDGSAMANVTGGTAPYTYTWNNGENTAAVSGLTSGWYYVTITDFNGCLANDSIEVTQPSAALTSTINASQNVNCFGGNNGSIDMNVTGGTLPYSFSWNNGEVTEDITNLPSGTYTVNITDANGCTTSNTITISQPSAALATVINGTINVSCFGGNNGNADLEVNGGTAPYSYNWNNGEITQDLTGLNAGTYSVTVTDANGCTSAASVTITEPAAALDPVLTMSQQVDCFGGENGAINLNVTGGTLPYSYTWSNGDTTQNVSNLMAGTYVVIVTDANGCEASGQLTLNQPVAPLLGVLTVTSNVFCNGGSNGALDLNINGGTPPYTFNWSNGETTEDISNLETGTYTVTVTDANGCSTTITEGIGQPNQQLHALVTVQQVLCFNGNNGLVDITPMGGTAPYVFIWNTGAVSEDIGGLFAGIYTVTISDANGCDTTITSVVSQPTAPLIPVLNVAQNVSCFGGNDGNISLSVSGGTPPYVYLWNTGATTAGINSLLAGAYTVTVTDANGCNAIISDFVAQPAAPLTAPITVAQDVSCFGGSNGSLVTNATGGTAPYTYLWNTGATTSSLNGLSNGVYTVTVTDSHGCTFTADAQLSQPSAPLSVSGSTTIANCLNGQGGSVTIQVSGGTPMYSYLWSNGSVSQNIMNAMPGSYSVTVTDANGCTATGNWVVGNNSSYYLSAGPNIICVGETATIVADSIPGGSYQWYYEGNPLNGATGLTFVTPAAGYYFVSVTVPCGTFFSDSIEVIVKSIENASITSDRIICPPEMVHLNATGGITYQWSPTSFMTFSNIPDPIVAPPISTTYSVLVTNEWGCTTTMDVDITVACDTLFIPNGFSPNDDGTNDGYVIDGIENYPGNKLWVYNRWGNLVFKTKNYDNSWDGVCNVSGIYMGRKVPTGTYYFILDLNDNSKPRAGFLIIRR